jgi:hypothetical protein
MAALDLSYCQLIKIVLSQIGGNPLQQVYNELHQGKPGIIPGSGVIPNALSEVKSLVDTVTNTIHAAQVAANDFSSTLEDIGGLFYQNPLGTALAGAIAGIDGRLVTVANQIIIKNNRINDINTGYDIYGNPYVSPPGETLASVTAERDAYVAEQTTLNTSRANLVTYRDNTNRLSGVTTKQTGAALAGGCSLQDLLGSACTPNDDVPDIDLQALVDSLKNKDYILAFTNVINNATGYADYQQALATFNSTINGLNASFIASINKASIRNAVTAQITQMVYNLLTGCGGQVLDITLQSNVKATVSKWVSLLESQNANANAYIDANGNVVTVSSVETSPLITASITVKEI